MLHVSVLSSVLENTGSLVDDPVGAEHRQHHAAPDAPRVDVNVHRHL